MTTHTLVTGGAGFLGSHLCERLLVRGDNLQCVDNLFTGDKRNVTHLLQHPHFELMRHDVKHTFSRENEVTASSANTLPHPLRHPTVIHGHRFADRWTSLRVFGIDQLRISLARTKRGLRRVWAVVVKTP
ncbi:MAG TPA: GDP-mannose 4,6-dehydratase [Povalibacter sp.]